METTSTTTPFTRTRIVALVAIAVIVAGLVTLAVRSGEDRVSVPAGAKSGELVMHDCTYGTEDGDRPADCGTLVVPENRDDPDSRLIAVPVTRIRARSAHPGEPIFRLEGGPGITNMDFEAASRFTDHHDVVLVGYRGVDGSVTLDCPEVDSALKRSTDALAEPSLRAYRRVMSDCAQRFTDDGVDVTGYGVVSQVDDLEAARAALGYDRVDLLSESAGTRTAMIYSWRYPASIHRSVMIGANPPGNFVWDPDVTDAQIRRYARYCADDPDCRERTDDLAASLLRTSAELPERWGYLPISAANVRIFSLYGLMESTEEAAPLSGPMTIGSWLSADEGDPSGLWLISFMGDLMTPPFTWGQYASFASVDADAASEYFAAAGPHADRNLGFAASAFGWGADTTGGTWPVAAGVQEYREVRTSQTETLVIGGELDFATPPQIATEQLLPHLPNGHQVVLEGFGHTVDFWHTQERAGTHLVTTFFDRGVVDDAGYVPQRVDFTPGVTHTALAKGIAATMAGLALVTGVGLGVLIVRVRGRRGTGPKTGAWIRSAGPVVFGLGGWFLAVLVMVRLWPSMPLDNPVLAVVSVGVPVWLGVYAGWARPATTTAMRWRGLVAAAAGALVGTGLGFHAVDGLGALFTGIAGAGAGSNLALIVLDLRTGRRAQPGEPTTSVEVLAEAAPGAAPLEPVSR